MWDTFGCSQAAEGPTWVFYPLPSPSLHLQRLVLLCSTSPQQPSSKISLHQENWKICVWWPISKAWHIYRGWQRPPCLWQMTEQVRQSSPHEQALSCSASQQYSIAPKTAPKPDSLSIFLTLQINLSKWHLSL